MTEAITPAVSDRICNHMNKDHGDAVLSYVHKFADQGQAQAATMTKIDSLGMDLLAETPAGTVPVRIEFDHQLADAKDAHVTLVDMLK